MPQRRDGAAVSCAATPPVSMAASSTMAPDAQRMRKPQPCHPGPGSTASRHRLQSRGARACSAVAGTNVATVVPPVAIVNDLRTGACSSVPYAGDLTASGSLPGARTVSGAVLAIAQHHVVGA